MKSPLRYPGGKSRAIKTIAPYFEKSDNYIFPFLGGGSIELFMMDSTSSNIICYDIFEPLVDFWDCLINENGEFISRVANLYPLSKNDFYKMSKDNSLKSKMENAVRFYVLNRCSFSGSTLSGGFSPNHPRFTEKGIESLKQYSDIRMKVEKLSFEVSIPKNKGFMYLDPPYLLENSFLYGNKGDTHRGFDHNLLFETVKNIDGWIMSYNDCEEIKKLYSGHKIISLDWKYGMSKNKISSELLIFSKN